MNSSCPGSIRASSATRRQGRSWARIVTLPVVTRRLTAGQLSDDVGVGFCVNVGIVYVHPLSVKSNSPEGPLRHMPTRHTVYFLYRAPYYAVAERRPGANSVAT